MNKNFAPLWYGFLVSSVALAAAADAAPDEGAERILRSAAGYAAEREPGTLRDVATFEESRAGASEIVTKPRSAGTDAATASAVYGDHWIYDAAVELFADADVDGYYRYLRVRFDVDTYYEHAWVYAKLYLSADGEVWELYYETDDFRVDGAVPDDEYEVETELVASYPTGLYDVLIELYDADTGVFVDEFGPAESSAFALLPLEDADHDAVTPPPVVVVTEGGGGGALSWPMLLLVGAGAALRAGLARARSRRG